MVKSVNRFIKKVHDKRNLRKTIDGLDTVLVIRTKYLNHLEFRRKNKVKLKDIYKKQSTQYTRLVDEIEELDDEIKYSRAHIDKLKKYRHNMEEKYADM